MITQAEIDKTATILKNAGVPDAQNRWLKMTPKVHDTHEAAKARIAAQQRGEGPMQRIGAKELGVRAQREEAAKPAGMNGHNSGVATVTKSLQHTKTADSTKLAGEQRAQVKKPHPADIANNEAIAKAKSFTVSLFHGGISHKEEGIPSLDAARAKGVEMVKTLGSHRLSLVYAVLEDGRSFPVPRDYQAPATQMETAMKTTTAAAKTPKAPAKKASAAKKTSARKPASKASQNAARTGTGDRARFDWKGASERAALGAMPGKLDFTAETHKPYRGLLESIEAAAKAGDLAALKKIKHDGFQGSSVKAALRWRDLCITALSAKK